MASEMIHADGQIHRPIFTLCIYFGYYLQEKRNRGASKRTYVSKWQRAYSEKYVLETATALNFLLFFYFGVICTGRSLTYFCVSRGHWTCQSNSARSWIRIDTLY